MGVAEVKKLEAWVEDWEVEELYTVKGGAQAAWWVTALELEHLNCQGITITGGSADFQKALDEIQRDLLYDLLRKGGFPERILKAYIKFRENLLVLQCGRARSGPPLPSPM